MFAIELNIKDRILTKRFLARRKTGMLYWSETLDEVEYFPTSYSAFIVAMNFIRTDYSIIFSLVKSKQDDMAACIKQTSCMLNGKPGTMVSFNYENARFTEYSSNIYAEHLKNGNAILS